MKINPAADRKNFHRDSGNPQCNLLRAGAHRFRQILLAAKERRERKEVFCFVFLEFFRGKFSICWTIYRNRRLPDWFCQSLVRVAERSVRRRSFRPALRSGRGRRGVPTTKLNLSPPAGENSRSSVSIRG
jgi:hypothetical protein